MKYILGFVSGLFSIFILVFVFKPTKYTTEIIPLHNKDPEPLYIEVSYNHIKNESYFPYEIIRYHNQLLMDDIHNLYLGKNRIEICFEKEKIQKLTRKYELVKLIVILDCP